MKIDRHLATVIAAVLAFVLGIAPSGAKQSAQRDYQRLSGEWQLTSAVIDGRAVPKSQVQRTVLITDGDIFRFPQASGAGTHPAGRFIINPNAVPKEVDSIAIGGSNAGQVTRGIYEIVDDTHKRACWAPPGGLRPTSFESLPGSKRIVQYWKKIGPVPKTR